MRRSMSVTLSVSLSYTEYDYCMSVALSTSLLHPVRMQRWCVFEETQRWYSTALVQLKVEFDDTVTIAQGAGGKPKNQQSRETNPDNQSPRIS
jgi:hypothetical protein